ncbi:MAG: amidohydrolase family protein [Bacteroidales bacterium]|nr:amidohydrolase family protein [Bacteroidales bacterium]MBO7764609.1 amidohydrolase family protein [Bacteroidales bacterium]
MLTQINNGKILTPNGWVLDHSLLIEDGKILDIAGSLPIQGAEVVDARGMYIVPGYVAMNVYGAKGHTFNEGTEEAFDIITKSHLQHGATTIFPTLSPTTRDRIIELDELCSKMMEKDDTTIKGLHVVSPYLSEDMTKEQYKVKNPDPKEYNIILEKTKCIKRWDAAPELPGSSVLAKAIKEKGILPVISHTIAEYKEVLEGFEAGFTHTAQLYNAMPGFHKKREYKYEGTVESVYLIDDMTTEVIADGKHLPATILRLVYKIKGVEKLALVTAALAYADYEGEVNPDDNVYIENGVCKVKGVNHLAGSIATMDTLVQNMVLKVGTTLRDAVRMASETPAKIMGIYDQVGSLEKGKEANVLILNHHYEICGIWSKGKQVK